jgi:hypothetical protein
MIDTKSIEYISIEEFSNNFDDGTFKFCRPEYYIRSSFSEESIDRKKIALLMRGDDICFEVKEPLVFETHPDGSRSLVSGNTRAKALLALLEQKSIEIDGETLHFSESSFKDIPVTYFNRLLTVHELIDYQVSTNDSTEPHSPYDIAKKISMLKPIYEQEFLDKAIDSSGNKITPKVAAGKATDLLCSDFKVTRQTISQYLNVINKGSVRLNLLVEAGNLSLDSANTIIGRLSKIDIDMDTVLHDLEAYAKATNPEDGRIYKSMIKNYFDNLELAASQPPEPFPPSSKSSDNFMENVKLIVGRVSSIPPEVLTLENSKAIAKLNKSMLDSLIKTDPYVETDAYSLELFDILKKAYLQRFSNLEELSDSMSYADKPEYENTEKLMGKIIPILETIAPSVDTDVDTDIHPSFKAPLW